ncbi:MAG: universal stress protein [Chlamydiia bacterium]|nr:universal stress protein [Chlamydiia bacterium]
MKHYKNILVCLDLSEQKDNSIMEKASAIAAGNKAELNVIHVIESLAYYATPYEIPEAAEWQNELERSAKKMIANLGKKYKIPEKHQLTPIGSPKEEIVKAAKKLGCDLIVIGSHGRHGINLFLLGSTANGVMQFAECDVLAVRMKPAE